MGCFRASGPVDVPQLARPQDLIDGPVARPKLEWRTRETPNGGREGIAESPLRAPPARQASIRAAATFGRWYSGSRTPGPPCDHRPQLPPTLAQLRACQPWHHQECRALGSSGMSTALRVSQGRLIATLARFRHLTRGTTPRT